MSKEDIAFLEEVMKNGIIDEGKRMQTILKELMEVLLVLPRCIPRVLKPAPEPLKRYLKIN